MQRDQIRALLIEDDLEDVLLLRESLAENSSVKIKISHAASLSAGLDQVTENEFDVILLDLNLPDSRGIDTLHVMIEKVPDLPVVVLSGLGDDATALEAVKRGAQDYLVKGETGGALVGRVLRYAIERKQINAALRESEERYRLLFNRMLDGFALHEIICDENGDPFDYRFLEINPAFEKLTGLKASNVIGRTVRQVLPDTEKHWIDTYGEVALTGRSVRFENYSKALDKHFEVLAFSPHERQFATIFTETTQRKQAEEELRDMLERFNQLVDNIHEGFWISDLENAEKTYLSPAITTIWGRPVESFKQYPSLFLESILQEDRQNVLAAIEMQRNGEKTETEYRIIRTDGSVRWIWDRAFPFSDSTGKVIRIAGVVTDITERKQANMALEKRANELETLYQTFLEINAQTDLNALLSSIVQRAVELIGVDSGALYLAGADDQGLELAVGYNWPENYTGITIELGEGLSGKVAQRAATMVVEDYRAWEGKLWVFDDPPMRRTLGVPLEVKNKVIGVITLSDHTKTGSFSNEEIRLAGLFASQAAIAIETAHLLNDAQRRLRQTSALRQIDQAIAGSMHLTLVLEIVLNHTISELSVDAAVILLYDPHENILKYEIGKGFQTDALRYTYLRLGEGYAGMAALSRQTIQVIDLQERKTDFLRSPSFHEEGFVCYFGVPLIAKGEVKGVLEIFHRSPLKPDNDWLDFMEALAGQVAIAIDNATLYKNLQRSNIELSMAYDATIEGWSRALDLRDKETEGHTQRVTKLTLQMAEKMGMSKEELVHVQRGALLHDIGKMGIPDRILLKPDKLTDDEWVLMRRHPVFAHEMLSPIKYLQPALAIPYCHHEKWDGSGYPRGLKSENIPLAARIFAVIDVYDALTSDRPYRPAWTKEATLHYIQEQAGTHFDPAVVDTFLSLELST